jgi:hypothetical protein
MKMLVIKFIYDIIGTQVMQYYNYHIYCFRLCITIIWLTVI